MEYVPPINGNLADPDRPYINANPGLGVEGSIPPAEAIEHTIREIVNVIDTAGLTPDGGDLTQLAQAIAVLAAGKQNNFTATVAPLATDDTGDGYSNGSIWYNTTGSGSLYICVSETLNNAVWFRCTNYLELATAAFQTVDTIRRAPVTVKNADYTFTINDGGQTFYHTDNTLRTWTIPPNSSVAFPLGTMITLASISTTAKTNIARGAGVTLYASGNTAGSADQVLPYRATGTLIKVDTDTWIMAGAE